MLDHPIVDVALGLVFVYLVLSLVCTAANETLSSVFAWRADFLKKGLANILKGEGNVDALFAHPLLGALIRPARWWQRADRYPSYLPSRAVISALLDGATVAPREAADAAEVRRPQSLAAAIETIQIPEVKRTFKLFLTEAQEEYDDARKQVEAFRRKAETWYDDSMARVSGWYRRRIQLVLWIVALLVAATLNADTIRIARTLWTDDAARAAIVAQAEKLGDEAEAVGDIGAADVNDLRGSLPVPLGWRGDSYPDEGTSAWAYFALTKLFGILLTAAALSLGAPFWFDLLGKVARLRSSGAPPPPRQKTETSE